MRSSKSRSRNKSNRQRTLGNIVNRVFDSSGPEGKVRGTPQQIIEKYLTLARDAQLSNDRVAEQSFFQHAEHYTRMLGEAQREQAERQGQQPGFSRDDDRDDAGQQGDYGQSGQSQQTGHFQRHDERRDDNRQDNNRQDSNRQDNRNENRRDNRRDDRRDQNRDDRQNDRRDDRQPRQEAQAEPAAEQGLPPVITAEERSGPVDTPEAAAPAPKPAERTEPAATQATQPEEPVPVPASAQPASQEELNLDAQPDAKAEKAPARRRSPRSPAAGTTTGTTAAPRRSRKPAAEAETVPASDKASGE